MMKKKRYGIVFDTRKCIDCRACTVACKAENDVPLGEENYRNWVTEEPVRGTYPNLGQSFQPSSCNQCGNPPCNSVCPTGATGIVDGGIVMVNPKKCIGCKYCMLACPYDARYFNDKTKAIDKCTFCIQRLAVGRPPACVETCPTKVRIFGDLNDPASEVSLLLAKHPYKVLKPELGTDPFLFYIS